MFLFNQLPSTTLECCFGVALTTGMDRNGPKWTGMEQEWTEMEHFLLKINNNFNHDTLKCN